MAYPVLAANYNWYRGSNYDSIAAVTIVDSYDESMAPSGAALVGSWAVDTAGAGDIMCYEFSDSTVILAGNGSGKIMANADCEAMFAEFSSLVAINGLRVLDTSSVTSMSCMFYMCSELAELDVSGFDTSSVKSMDNMFFRCSALVELDVSNFDTASVENTKGMFNGCSKLTEIDVSNFDTSSVYTMELMFSGCSALTTIYASQKWSTESVTDSTNMFYGASKLVGGNGTAYSSSATGATYARIDTAETPGYFTYRQARSDELLVTVGTMRDIADAIREKTGSTDSLTPSQMVEAILSIGTS